MHQEAVRKNHNNSHTLLGMQPNVDGDILRTLELAVMVTPYAIIQFFVSILITCSHTIYEKSMICQIQI